MKQRFSRRWLVFLLAIALLAAAIFATRVVAQNGGLGVECPPDCMVSFSNPSTLLPASDEAVEINALFNFILIAAGIVFVLVESALVFAVLRHRNRPPESAVQFHGNTKLEIAWTAAPAIVLAVVMGATLQTMGSVRAVTSENVVRVTAVGHQWWWEFRYPELGIVTANEMVVPVGSVIEVALESVDVEHGFWAPELFGKIDAVPGYTNRVRFTPTQVRNDYFGGQCTQFCGVQHAQMRFAIVVRSPAEFQAWASQMQQPPAESLSGDAAAGREIFLSSQCVGCHTIEGTIALGQAGPNLTHLASRGFIAGAVLPNTPSNLQAWITDPQAIKPGVVMPSAVRDLGLSDQQVSDLVAYLTTLR